MHSLNRYASCSFQVKYPKYAIYKLSLQSYRIIFILTSVTFANAGAAMKTT